MQLATGHIPYRAMRLRRLTSAAGLAALTVAIGVSIALILFGGGLAPADPELPATSPSAPLGGFGAVPLPPSL